jgi:oligopeptide/dipeptide ABC transporter ATP-binding protein
MSVLVETKNLKKYFSVEAGVLHAVDDVSIQIREGETFGIVGESGCGKSTLGKTIIRLQEATSGEVLYKGENIHALKKRKMKELRRDLQIIFQDPYSSLNPRMNVLQIITEPMVIAGLSGREAVEKAKHLMEVVGLAARLEGVFPHELDGGRRQRIGIARALSVDPTFIVCDEPVSALDVSIQAQILNLMMDLQEQRNLTYLFITHNLAVVRLISDQIGVMYLGQCVEIAPTDELFERPLHPYTKALLASVPVADLSMRHRQPEVIRGEISSPVNPIPGCRFAPRCPYVTPLCTEGDIPLKDMGGGHSVACTLY